MRPGQSLFFVIFIAIILLFVRLGATTVFQVAEARNSVVPKEMIDRNDYIVPYFNNTLRTDKPPLHYYAMLAGYKIGGVNETAARFFSAVCGLLVIIATWLFAKKNNGSGWPAIVLLSSIHCIMQFRLATPDPYLIACHVLSLFCFWEAWQQQKKYYWWLMYALWGLAFLAKGPVGIALPAFTVFLFLLFTKNFRWANIRKMQPIAGLLIMAAIATPWFWLVHKHTHGEWTRGFFLEHNVSRFNDAVDNHRGPFVLPLAFVIGGLFPFSVFMIRAGYQAWKNRKENQWLLFNLLAAAAVIITYSFAATKLINYISPSYPFIAMLVGWLIQKHILKQGEKKWWPEWIVLLIISIALPAGLFFWMQSDISLKNIAVLGLVFSVFSMAVIVSFYFYKNNRREKAFNFLAGGAVLINALFFLLLYPAMGQQDSILRISPMMKTDRPVIGYRNFNEAFVFYHGKPIVLMKTAAEVSSYLEANPRTLVLEKSKKPVLPDSLAGIRIIAKEKDLFSSRFTFVYERQATP